MKDYTLGETVDFKFTTCEPDTGAPITLAGTPVISAYVDNSTTQITAGITLTVDFDGVTGLHNVRVVATSGNGFTTGTNVALIITTGTVDGVSAVGYKVAEFSLGRPGTSNVTQFNGTAATASGGRPEVNASHWAGTAVGSTTVRADLINIAGAAVSTTTAQLGVNAVQISGDGTAADNVELAFDNTAGSVPSMGIVDQGTAQSATGTTLVLRAAAAFADDELIGATIQITGGTTGVGQSRLITDYDSATDTATVDTWTTTPTGTITYKIYGTAPGSGGAGLDAAGVRAAIGMASANLDTQLSAIDTVVDAILVDTGTTLDGRIPAALVSGRMDVSVGAMAANVLTATAINADAITAAKIANGAIDAATFAADVDAEILSYIVDDATRIDASALNTASVTSIPAILVDTGTTLDTALATVDTVVDAIKAKTDSLTFTVANVLDGNVQRINDVAITGDGQPGTEFGV